MNHPFESNPTKPDKCLECGYEEIRHGDTGLCECCDKTGNLVVFQLAHNNRQMLLHSDCKERELALMSGDFQALEMQNRRLDEYNKVVKPYEELVRDARKIDEQIHLSTDIFNAKTVSFIELRDAINADDKIEPNAKHFELARLCKERINHLQQVIFNLDKQKIDAYSEQKSWHIQLNDLANELRTEEREKLRISDITYDVKMPKPVTPRAIKVTEKAIDKNELNKLSAELNIPAPTLKMVMVSKNWTVEQVGNHFRRCIKEGQSMGSNNTENK